MQYAIEDLIKQVQGDCYELEVKSVVASLKLKYNDDVIVSTSKKQKTTICFCDTGYKILTNQWYTEKKVTKIKKSYGLQRLQLKL